MADAGAPNSTTHDSSRVTVRQTYTVFRFHVLTISSIKRKSHRGPRIHEILDKYSFLQIPWIANLDNCTVHLQ